MCDLYCGATYSPENVLNDTAESSKKMLTIYYQKSVSLLCIFIKDESYGTEDIENLRSLVSNLRQLLDLLHKYGCRIKLSDFEKVCF